MDHQDPLDPILVKADAYAKTWIELPGDLRRRIEARAPVLAGRGFPYVSAIAIVENPTPATWGTWQFSFDGGSSWIDVPGDELGDQRAIVLPCPAPVRFVARDNWFGTPRSLTFRLWLGCGPVQPSKQSISASIGDAGPWSVDRLELADNGHGTMVSATQLATGSTWDMFCPDERRAEVQRHDDRHSPAGQRAFDLVCEIDDLKREEVRWQLLDTRNLPSEELLKREGLARLRREREWRESELDTLCLAGDHPQPVVPEAARELLGLSKQASDAPSATEATSDAGGIELVRLIVEAVRSDGKQLKRSAFNTMVDKLVDPPRGQKKKERGRLWRELAEDWKDQGQGSPGNGGAVIEDWESYRPAK